MNEQIRKLAEDARGQMVVLTTVDEQTWKQHEEFVEKFAELIVKECVDICYKHPARMPSNNWASLAVPVDIAQRLKEHFGIE